MKRIKLLVAIHIALLTAAGCNGGVDVPEDGIVSDILEIAMDAEPADVTDVHDGSTADAQTHEPQNASPGMAYHEHALSELPEGVHLNQDDTVALWLEHPVTGLTSSLDTGSVIGTDALTFEYFYAHNQTFCWNDLPEGEPHRMSLIDADGNEVLNVAEGEGCKTVAIEPGIYTQKFTHSGEGTSGELIFLKPTGQQETAAELYARASKDLHERAAGSPCVPTRTITAADVGQLAAGEIAVTDTCAPGSGTTAWVFNQNCGNFTTTAGAPKIQIAAMWAGPSTAAIIYSGSNYTGISSIATNSGTSFTCVAEGIFSNDLHWDMQRSFKVWTNDAISDVAACRALWIGPAGDLPSSGPADGEVWLYSEPNRSGIGYKFNGSCHDLCNITASQVVSSAWIGNNTVMTIYADPDYLGSMFAFQHIVDNLYQYDNMARSIYVQSLTSYNNETTLITKKNCDYCNLIGMRLMDGENLSGASLVQANLTNARLVGVDLSSANATGATFRGANMAYANLKGATLSNAIFEADSYTLPADLSYAYMPNAKLDHAHLNNVTANYAQIYGAEATVLQATMVGIRLANAILSNMNFNQAAMKGATLTGANLISASFLGADLTGADLVNAAIQGTVFDGATLYGAKLQNSTVSFEPGSLTIQRLGDNNTLEVASVSFNATSIPKETTNASTFCPYGGQSDDGNVYCDSVSELTAPNPPAPPACIPSPTKFCPRPTK